ncbi:hypothetical protein QBC47DRAFT_392111 [Echria macrotheca]|uniref:F-box domain-containing protein n=1 Tax=Echria macrotheca TaxID=438768 RepID=A0AAJ0B3J9_9PEZI|nr:hypothetical protein QBC47DRAFT_392111 [Echria macrotheca]
MSRSSTPHPTTISIPQIEDEGEAYLVQSFLDHATKSGRLVPANSNRDAEEPLVDLTQALPLRSKRTERLRKKLEKKSKTLPPRALNLLDLPQEIFTHILTFLRPSDIIAFRNVSKDVRNFVLAEETYIANAIIKLRYPVLAKCLPPPVSLSEVDPSAHEALLNPERSEVQTLFIKPFQHVPAPDAEIVCSCLACIQRWLALCVVVDFAHWQDHLDKSDPIPVIPRGTRPSWNELLLFQHSVTVLCTMRKQLWYARLLEKHLDSTVRSIRRHSANKGNRRRRFRMTEEDAAAGTDAFLERSGPPTVDLPFHRDNYYMLEAFLPNRSWIADRQAWVYVPLEQHDNDVRMLVQWHPYRQKKSQEKEPTV